MERNENKHGHEQKDEQQPSVLRDALNTLNNAFDAYKEYTKIKEQNKTERKRIQAEKEKALSQIEATKEALMYYLDKSFDERKMLFSKDFSLIDSAIESNNVELMALDMQSINNLASKSPFGALADMKQVKQNFLGNNEIEI